MLILMCVSYIANYMEIQIYSNLLKRSIPNEIRILFSRVSSIIMVLDLDIENPIV